MNPPDKPSPAPAQPDPPTSAPAPAPVPTPVPGGQNFSIHIGSNTGVAVFGSGNVVHATLPSLQALNLPPEQAARVTEAVKQLEAGQAASADAQALARAAGAADERTRGEQIKAWLVKMAPALLGAAGSLINPIVGEVAKAAGQWAAKALGNEPP